MSEIVLEVEGQQEVPLVVRNVEFIKGISPKVEMERVAAGLKITITDIDGEKTNYVYDGAYVHVKYAAAQPTQDSDMKDSADAWMGVYSGASQTAPEHYTSYEWYNTKGATGATGSQGPAGQDGKDGKDGQDGQDGQDGVSPEVEVTTITGGHRVSVTDAGGTETFDVMDGQDGQDGAPGVGIPSGGSTGKYLRKKSGTDYDTEWADIFDAVYPVGSIYMSVVSTSPATLFGGTWSQLEDRFLVGAGQTYTAGGTGGSATHTLTTDEIPSHTHGLNSHTHSVGAHAHGLNSHTHGAGSYSANSNGSHKHQYPLRANASSGAYFSAGIMASNSGSSWNTETESGGSHTHTISGTSGAASGNTANSTAFDSGAASGDTASTGGGNAFSVLPPYLAVYMWKRTA